MLYSAKVRELLAAEGIDYYVKVVNRNSSGVFNNTGIYGTFGQDMKIAYEYIIYVHKKDYDRAGYLISKLKRDEL